MTSIIKLLFFLWPIAEMMVFISMVSSFGWLLTLSLIAAGVLVGVILLRFSNTMTIRSLQSAMMGGRVSSFFLFDNAFLVIAALLFILPGFISDFFAVLLLISPLRRALKARFSGEAPPFGQAGANPFDRDGADIIIEGDYTVVPDQPDPDGPRSNDDCANGSSMIAKPSSSPGAENERK